MPEIMSSWPTARPKIYDHNDDQLKSGGNEKTEKESPIGALWRKYNFKGNPPRPGTPVEGRLNKACYEYISYIQSRAQANISEETPNNITRGSDTHQRDLHDQIAQMVFGLNRSQLPNNTAEKISDFACELIQGMTLKEFEKLIYFETKN